MNKEYYFGRHLLRNPNYESQSTRYLKSVLKPIIRFGRDFCLETTIHGFNHIAVAGRYWIERVLWVAITAAAIWGAINISLGQLQRYQDNPTVITLEKDFRTWRFNLPAITVCDANRVDISKLPQAIESRFKVKPGDDKYPYYEKFVKTVANSDLFHLKEYEEFKDNPALDVDLLKLAEEVMAEVHVKATWSNGQAVPWFPALTEAGVCYTTNCVALAHIVIKPITTNDTKLFPLTCKYSQLNCYVILEIVVNSTFYVHSPYDITEIASHGYLVFPSLNRVTELSVIETFTGKGVRELKPQRRGCLYTDEPVQKGIEVYSTNTCRLSCRSKMAIKLCGCKPFYYVHEDGPTCSPAGMACLAQYAHMLASNGGVKCSCSPQCVDATFKELSDNEEVWSKGPFALRGAVRFTVQPPRTRYTRAIVFNFQDLVVSFGGAAGLFLGASFISFVEIFYFIIERFLRIFRKRNKNKVAPVTNVIKNHSPTYEAEQIKELTDILENQNRFAYFNKFKY